MLTTKDFFVGISEAFLINELTAIAWHNSKNNDPGDLDRLKLNGMYRRVFIGLAFLLRSVNKDCPQNRPLLFDFMFPKLGYIPGVALTYWNTTISDYVTYTPTTVEVLSPVSTENLKIWKDEYSLLLWELEIRKNIQIK